MPFDLVDRPLVFIWVRWPGVTASDDGAAVPVEHEVEVQIELLDLDEQAQWFKDTNAALRVDAPEAGAEIAAFRRVAKGWRGVKSNGRQAEFSDANIMAILRTPGFSPAFGKAFSDALDGRIAVREGNSGGSLANGLAGEPTVETARAATPTS